MLLVGGISLMPSVQALVKAYFGDASIHADKPFTAVAEGALQVAAGYGLDDYLSQSYGLRYLDPQTGQHHYEEILPMGSHYPSDRPVEVDFSGSYEGQNTVEFVVGAISVESSAMIEVRYEGGQAVFVAQAGTTNEQVVPLNEGNPVRMPLDPSAKLGEQRLRARFTVDDQRRLQVTVIDIKKRRELITDVVIATLGKADVPRSKLAEAITGQEPHLVDHPSGQRRLSLRSVATLLNALPPEAISLPTAEAALRSNSFGARYNATVALSKRGDRDARNIMARVLMDGNVPARASVARHLNGFSWYAAEALFQQALADADPRVREAAVYALCDLRDRNAYRVMTEALLHDEDNVRAAAAFGLRDCQDAEAVPVLKAVLLANDPEVRIKALEALSNNDSLLALPVVRSALTDTHPDVLYAATLSLLELAHERALDELGVLIENTHGSTRETILRAFFHATNYLNMNLAEYVGVEALFNALDHALQDSLPSTRMATFWPLAWIRHERANHLLSHAYRHESDSGVKAHLVRVVVALMSPVGEEILRDALLATDPQVVQAAERIMEARARAGIVLQYDESAAPGLGFAKPGAGR